MKVVRSTSSTIPQRLYSIHYIPNNNPYVVHLEDNVTHTYRTCMMCFDSESSALKWASALESHFHTYKEWPNNELSGRKRIEIDGTTNATSMLSQLSIKEWETPDVSEFIATCLMHMILVHIEDSHIRFRTFMYQYTTEHYRNALMNKDLP